MSAFFHLPTKNPAHLTLSLPAMRFNLPLGIWLKERKNREFFDSAKADKISIVFLGVPNGEIYGTKAEKAVKFNKR